MKGFVVPFCVFISFAVGKGIFNKPIGFGEDSTHGMFFRKLDSDGDRHISREEFTLSLNVSDSIFDYLIARRMNSTSNIPGLTYREFMWFYRESDLYSSIVPCPPEKLYSFPSWPGMKSMSVPEEDGSSLTPSVFWNSYVSPHKAVVLRNGLAGSLALERWKDPGYFKSRFGDLSAKIEVKKEARGDRTVLKPNSTRATISDVVDGLIEDAYVVSVVPQPMAWEVTVPRAVLCGDRGGRRYLGISDKGSYLTQLEETSLWISRGSTRSQFHYDKENTVNCLVAGNPKEWVILDTRKYAHLLPWVRQGGFDQANDLNTKYTDWVGVDVDRLDLVLHNYLLEVEFETVTQFPGDCVFLPYSMLHYAQHPSNDNDTLQVAVSYMWLPETQFDSACAPPASPVPLAVFDHVWYFDGHGVIPQGLHDPRLLASALVSDSGTGFNVAGVLEFLPVGTRSGASELGLVVQILDLIKDMLIKGLAIPLDLWLQLSSAIDMNSIGCNDNKVYVPRPMEEMNSMLAYLDV